MQKLNRPIVLSVAGYDPSGGAGLLADIKTIEQHKVYGLGIASALTFQTENEFFSLKWADEKEVVFQLKTYLMHYQIKIVKFGLAQNWKKLNILTDVIKTHNDNIKVIVDPILKSSSGFKIITNNDKKNFKALLHKIDLLTPNCDEAMKLTGNNDGYKGAKHLSQYCDILLKGGHNSKEPGTDYLFAKGEICNVFKPHIPPSRGGGASKHGSGCVLSAAIAANLALGYGMLEACKKAKQYTERFLNSNKSLVGYHVQ